MPVSPSALAVHLPPDARVEEPLHQLGTADAERILEILVRPGAVAVDGHPKALNAKFRHGVPRFFGERNLFPDAAVQNRGSRRGATAPPSPTPTPPSVGDHPPAEMGSEAGFHRDRSQFMDARPLSQRSPLSRKPASDPFLVRSDRDVGRLTGDRPRTAPAHIRRRATARGPWPRRPRRAFERTAGSGGPRPGPRTTRPADGGGLSPPEDTGPPSGRCFCAGAGSRVAEGGTETPARGEMRTRNHDGSSFRPILLPPPEGKNGGGERGWGDRGGRGENGGGRRGLPPPPATLITVRRSRLPSSQAERRLSDLGGAGAKPL